MKVMSSLVIALLAIFSIFASANISPVSIATVGNAGQYSVAVSEFSSPINFVEGDSTGNVAFYFPGLFPPSSPAYDKLDCITAIAIDNPKFTIKRFTSNRSDSDDGYTRISHELSFKSGDILGRFKTACSFIAPAITRTGIDIISTCGTGGRGVSYIIDKESKIHPLNSVIGGISAYISPTFSINKPTAFRIVNINKAYTSDRHFIIRNPRADDATTGTVFTFLTYSSSVLCDVYWDGVLYPKSAEASLIEDGNAIYFALGSPLNAADELIVYCYDLRGIAFTPGFPNDSAKFFPSILEFSYANAYKAYTLAITPARPDNITFQSGFTIESPFPHFTPKSILE